MSAELNDLFECSMPGDAAILEKMAAAKQRRRRAALRRAQLLRASGVCLAGAMVALWVTSTPMMDFRLHPTPSIEPERLLASPKSTDLDEPAGSAPAAAGSSLPSPHETGEGSPSKAIAPPITSPVASARPRPEADQAFQLENVPQTNTASTEGGSTADSTPSDSPDATWAAAASALREGRRDDASRLLSRLAQSEDPETRDAATLAQFRTLIQRRAEGRPPLNEEQLTQLRTLAHSGRTASIRASARRLLNQVESAPAVDH